MVEQWQMQSSQINYQTKKIEETFKNCKKQLKLEVYALHIKIDDQQEVWIKRPEYRPREIGLQHRTIS